MSTICIFDHGVDKVLFTDHKAEVIFCSGTSDYFFLQEGGRVVGDDNNVSELAELEMGIEKFSERSIIRLLQSAFILPRNFKLNY